MWNILLCRFVLCGFKNEDISAVQQNKQHPQQHCSALNGRETTGRTSEKEKL